MSLHEGPLNNFSVAACLGQVSFLNTEPPGVMETRKLAVRFSAEFQDIYFLFAIIFLDDCQSSVWKLSTNLSPPGSIRIICQWSSNRTLNCITCVVEQRLPSIGTFVALRIPTIRHNITKQVTTTSLSTTTIINLCIWKAQLNKL